LRKRGLGRWKHWNRDKAAEIAIDDERGDKRKCQHDEGDRPTDTHTCDRGGRLENRWKIWACFLRPGGPAGNSPDRVVGESAAV